MVPQIFDRKLLRMRRKRARQMSQRQSSVSPEFLFERIADDLEMRLAGIKREFARVLYLGHQSVSVLEMLKRSGKVGEIVCTESEVDFLRENQKDLFYSEGDDLSKEQVVPLCRNVVCDEEVLPFAEGQFDLCISTLGLQFVNDLPGSLTQICSLLKPDGLFLGVMAGGATLTELRDVLMLVEMDFMGGVSPRVSPFMDVRDAGGLLQRAGFCLPVADTDLFSISYAHLFDLIKDLRALGAANLLHERTSKNWSRRVWMETAARYQETFPSSGNEGRIHASCELIYLTGWREHESQQKPLKPGSAVASFEEAVNKTMDDR